MLATVLHSFLPFSYYLIRWKLRATRVQANHPSYGVQAMSYKLQADSYLYKLLTSVASFSKDYYPESNDIITEVFVANRTFSI